ncbi:hypothetical protein [Demequina sp. NBRC 110055]|uniref:hypothetical protein n=1 Tax=Demequina sp. NBRC 110055 TaxID=1570344 RepID=UPI001356563C|nr:hypothetical protein [Demequina sp. NBRC 110055]
MENDGVGDAREGATGGARGSMPLTEQDLDAIALMVVLIDGPMQEPSAATLAYFKGQL